MEQEYRYMVCTSCMTYNHAPYIVDAMNGFTMQETTFPVYYLITDDASTDGEPEVIKQYLADHFQTPYRIEDTDDYYLICAVHKTNPNCKFIVFFLKYNHHSIKKSKLPYQSEWRDNAKYIALCEGDDYWNNPGKLQTQVDILENNEKVGIVYSKASIFNQEQNEIKGHVGCRINGFAELILHNAIPTLTVVYRCCLRAGFEKIRNPEWKMGDYPLWLYIALQADIIYIDEVFAVYRVLQNSASHSNSYQKMVSFYESIFDIQKYFVTLYNRGTVDEITKVHNQERFDLAYFFNEKKDLKVFYPFISKTKKNRLKFFLGNHRLIKRVVYKLK